MIFNNSLPKNNIIYRIIEYFQVNIYHMVYFNCNRLKENY